MLLGQEGNSLVSLLILNAIIFVLLNFIKVIYLLTGDTEGMFLSQVLSQVMLPGDPAVYITRPWTLISFMFSHYSFWLLLSNMLWLWCFGYILQDLDGNKKIVPIYLYGGFIGGIFFLLTTSTFPALKASLTTAGPLIGSGPALMALAIATTAIAPNYRIFPLIKGGIPLWVLAATFFLIHFLTKGILHPAFAVADIAGALVGFVFVWQLKKGNDYSEWMINLSNWLGDLFNPDKKNKKKTEKQKLYYKSTQQPYQKTPHVTQQRIDELLDKINQKGYHFLTDEEKEFLKKASKEEF